MNRIHSLAIGTILIFALTAPAQQATNAPGATDNNEHVQPGMQGGVPGVDEQMKVLVPRLGLTADQQVRIRPILQELHDVTVKIVQDPNLSHEERLAKVRPARYKARDQIREVLNDEQKEQFDQYLQGPHPEMHGNLNGAAPSAQTPQE